MRSSISSNSRLPAGYRQLSRSKIQSRIWAKRGSMAVLAPSRKNAPAKANLLGCGSASPKAREQHADTLAIGGVAVTVIMNEVALLVTDSDQHIGRHAKAQQQMPGGHVRRGPECQEETRIKRVGDPFVEQGLAQLVRLRFPAAHVEPGLLQPEQFEVIEQEGADQHDQPAEPEQAPQYRRAERVGDRPQSPLD